MEEFDLDTLFADGPAPATADQGGGYDLDALFSDGAPPPVAPAAPPPQATGTGGVGTLLKHGAGAAVESAARGADWLSRNNPLNPLGAIQERIAPRPRQDNLYDVVAGWGEKVQKDAFANLPEITQQRLNKPVTQLWRDGDLMAGLTVKAIDALPSMAPAVIGGGAGLAAKGLGMAAKEAGSLALGVGTAGDVAQSIGGTAGDIEQGITEAKDDELQKGNATYKDLRAGGMDEATAKRTLAQMSTTWQPLASGLVTAVTNKFGIEGAVARRLAGEMIVDGFIKGRLKNALSTGMGEAFQEGIESGIQEMLGQQGVGTGYDWAKIGNAIVDGSAVGGALGGATGVALGGEHAKPQKDVAAGQQSGLPSPGGTGVAAPPPPAKSLGAASGGSAAPAVPGASGTPAPVAAPAVPTQTPTVAPDLQAALDTAPQEEEELDPLDEEDLNPELTKALITPGATPSVIPTDDVPGDIRAAIEGVGTQQAQDARNRDRGDRAVDRGVQSGVFQPPAPTPPVPVPAAAPAPAPVPAQAQSIPPAAANVLPVPPAAPEAVVDGPPPAGPAAPAPTVAPSVAPPVTQQVTEPAPVADEDIVDEDILAHLMGEEPAPAEPAPAPKPKPSKAKAAKEKAQKERERVDDYFTVGNVVESYGGQDEVLGFERDDTGGMTARVRAVRREGDKWVPAGPERTHQTVPGPRAKVLERKAPEETKENARAPARPQGTLTLKAPVTVKAEIKQRGKPKSKIDEATEGQAKNKRTRMQGVRAIVYADARNAIDEDLRQYAEEAIDEAVSEQGDAINNSPGSISEKAKQLREKITARAQEIAASKREAFNASEAARTVAGVQKNRELSEQRLAEGKPQEKERERNEPKSAAGIEAESERTFLRRMHKEVETQGENASKVAKMAVAIDKERTSKKGGATGGKLHLRRIELTRGLEKLRLIAAGQKRATEPEKPKLDVQQAVKEQTTSEGLSLEERQEATEKARATVAAERAAPIDARLQTEVLDKHPLPEKLPVGPGFQRAARAHLAALVQDLRAFVAKLPDARTKLDARNSKAENFLVYATKLLGRTGGLDADMAVTDLISARVVMEQMTAAEFHDLVKTDVVETSQGEFIESQHGDDTSPVLSDEAMVATPEAMAKLAEQVNLSELDAYFAEESARQSVQINNGDTLTNSVSGFSVRVNKGDKFSARDILRYTKDGEPMPHRKQPYMGGISLRNVSRKFGKGSFFSMMGRALDKQLTKLVGDVPVYILKAGDVMKLGRFAAGIDNVDGFYSEPSIMDRANGSKGAIIISDEVMAGDPDYASRVLRHELVHAATIWAIRANYRGMAANMIAIRQRLVKHYGDNGWTLHDFGNGKGPIPATVLEGGKRVQGYYPLFNIQEMVAEAFTNPQFQEELARIGISKDIKDNNLPAIIRDEKGTVWEALLRVITNMLKGAGFHRGGESYLDLIIRLSADAWKVDEAHNWAILESMKPGKEAVARSRAPGSELLINGSQIAIDHMIQPAHDPEHPFDSAMIQSQVQEVAKAVRQTADLPGARSGTRMWVNKLKTLAQIGQDAGRYFGPDNPLQKVVDIVRQHATAARRRMVEGFELTGDYVRLGKRDPKAAELVASLAHDGTVHGFDFTVPLSDKANKHIAKTGPRWAQVRAMHATAYARFQGLAPEVQAHVRAMGAFFKKQQDDLTEKTVEAILEEAELGQILNLPPGVTRDQIKTWVMDGGIDRVGAQQTTFDVEAHKALGAVGKQLKAATGMRLRKGFYVPLMRRGDHILVAERKVDPVPGAALINGNQLLFKDNGTKGAAKKAAEAWLGKSTEVLSGKPQGFYYDPVTGNKVPKQEVDAEHAILITIQNKHVEAFDNLAEALKTAEEMRASPEYHSVRPVQHRRDMFDGSNELMPDQIKAMLRSVDQTSQGKDPTAMKQLRGAIVQASIQQMAGTRIQHRHLMRRNILGYNKDLARSLQDYNVSTSHYLTSMDSRPQQRHELARAQEIIEARAKNSYAADDPDLRRMQELLKATRDQLEANANLDPSGATNRIISAVTTLSFLKFLASPAHSLINAMQPGMVTLPYLGARFGEGKASLELTRAYGSIGAHRTLGHGFVNVARAVPRLVGRGKAEINAATRLIDRVKGKDAADVKAMLKEMQSHGLIGDEAGLELDASELGKNFTEKALVRVAGLARAMPEAIESINRATTGIAAYRLSRNAGQTHEQAVATALDTVNDTQGDYSQAVAPMMFKSKIGRVVLQFKKYPQMIGRILARSVYDSFKGRSRKERIAAAKTLAYMSITHGMMAGAVGLPFMELAKFVAIAAVGLGLDDDDWEDWENKAQGAFKSILGDTLGEAAARGLPRLLNMDLSGRVGLDSLIMFGSPKTVDSVGITAWVFDSMAGAPVGMMKQVLEGIANGNLAKTFIIPKAATDIGKAITGATEPAKTKAGRVLEQPYGVWPAIVQGLGIQPGEVAQRFEHGGSGYRAAQKAKQGTQRQTEMGKWLNAATAGERAAAWQEIRSWNRGKSPKDMITMGDLQRTKKRRVKEAVRDAAERRRETQGAE